MRTPSAGWRRSVRLPLRARVTATFVAITLIVTVTMAIAAYAAVRSYLLDQRTGLATRQAFLNARVAKSQLLTGSEPSELVASLEGGTNSQVFVSADGEWYSSSVALDPDQLPAALRDEARSGHVARQRFMVGGVPHLALAVPLPAVPATYVEVVALRELDKTLSIVGAVLAVMSAVAIVVATVAGWFAGRRLFRPLERMSSVAVAISDGRFDRRMDDEGDRDLRSITHSFNEMVDSLQERIEREARFASEVSHELRTPLTALSTSIEVVSRRKDELPERVRRAVDVLESQVAYFERLVLDLLEISRLDAGVESALHEDVDLREFVERLAELHHAPRPACEGDGSWVVRVDKRRLERVLANLVENANRHGGGVSAIRLRSADGCVAIAVEDQGPGIPPEDRSRVFERFWRGVAARQSATKGTGLGMALVARHLNMLGGTISVEANEREGARLVVSLPAPQEPA